MEILGVVAFALAVVWGILGLCIPFMVYSIMESNKCNKRLLEQLNRRLAKVTQ